MGEGEKYQLGTIGALSLSVVSSVSIVICNKTLMSSLHFIFGKFIKDLVLCKLIEITNYLYVYVLGDYYSVFVFIYDSFTFFII